MSNQELSPTGQLQKLAHRFKNVVQDYVCKLPLGTTVILKHGRGEWKDGSSWKRKQRKEKKKAVFKRWHLKVLVRQRASIKDSACGYSIKIGKEGEKKMVTSTSFSKGVGGQEEGIFLPLLLESIPAGPWLSDKDVKISKWFFFFPTKSLDAFQRAASALDPWAVESTRISLLKFIGQFSMALQFW